MHDYFADDPRSNRERMLDGDWYINDDPTVLDDARRGRRLLDRYNSAFQQGDPNANDILRELVGSLGEDVEVRAPFHIDYGYQIFIGDRTFINCNVVALDVAPIHIGADCQIAPGVQFLTPYHPLDPTSRRDKVEAARPITIEDNVWLGANVLVCPGVTIGENTVVGTGAVVTRDLPPNVLAMGAPARVVKELEDLGGKLPPQ